MKSNVSSESATPHPAVGQDTSANGYAPSVPLSVYRELAAELQNAKAKINALALQNQKLTQQNQQLRQNVEQVIQTALSLRQSLETQTVPGKPPETAASLGETPILQVTDDITEELKRSLLYRSRSNPKLTAESANGDTPEAPRIKLPFSQDDESTAPTQFVIEENPQMSLTHEKAGRGLSSLWLTITIILVVVTSFGAGFSFIWFFQNQTSEAR